MAEEELITNKRVTILGPLEEPNIPPTDTFVHLNHHYPDSPHPCQILFWNTPHPFNELPPPKDLQLAYVYLFRPNSYRILHYCQKHKVPFKYFTLIRRHTPIPERFGAIAWPDRLEAALKTLPLTGFMALYKILRHDPKSVFLGGMNLYPEHQTMGNHDLPKHRLYLSKLKARYGESLILNEGLQDTLYGPRGAPSL